MSSDEESFAEIERLSRQWMDAWVAQDRTTLESILAPDYALIISMAPTHRVNRVEWLETAVGPYVCSRFAYDAVQMRRINDDLIAMSAIADFDATIRGVDRSGRYFVTDVWRRSEGGWQVCARYSSLPGQADASVRALVERSRS